MLSIKLVFRIPLTILNRRALTVLTRLIDLRTQKNMTPVLLLKNVIRSNRMMCLNFTWLSTTKSKNSPKSISNSIEKNISNFKFTKIMFFKNCSVIRIFGLLKQKTKKIYKHRAWMILSLRSNTLLVLSPTTGSSNPLKPASINMVRSLVFNTSSLNSSS